MLDQISVVIITKNAGETLAKSLESAAGFSEVVVYDNGSEDTTLDVARRFGNVALHQGEFFGFGPTKNHAVSLAKNDWVLSLDADEQITPELSEYLENWTPADDRVIGIIRRENCLMGKPVNRAGWGNDWLLRLFNRKTHRFDDAAVHERVPQTANSKPEKLPFTIRHNAVRELGQFLEKANYYTELRRQTSDKTFHPALIVLRSLFAFFKSYIIKLGILAGWRGLVIAWGESNGVFYKYMKIYADQNR